MSAEMVTMIIGVVTILLAFASAFGWMISRADKQFQHLDTTLRGEIHALDAKMERRFEKVDDRFDKIDERFEKVDERFDKIDERFEKVDGRFQKIDERFEKVDERLVGIEHEMTDVKISVARIEGPRPRVIQIH